VLKTPNDWLRELFQIPSHVLPDGEWLELPGRGRTWLTDVPGPTVDAPSIVLLHAVGCTGQLSWFPVIEKLSKRFRVITFDQRWHGRGIQSEAFSLRDCADDVAAVIIELGLEDPIVAGYSMGSIIAQRTWRQHPGLVGGLVFAATTDHFRNTLSERVFHEGMELSMGALRTLSRSRSVNVATRNAARALRIDPNDTSAWALDEWRSTSPWAVAQAVAALGRHHSTPWLAKINVPTAVVVTKRDKVLPPERQRSIADRIAGATTHEVDCGHAGCVLDTAAFVPGFIEAVNTTAARIRDRQRLRIDA
jgi:pimeloyl-ACP methyl ester carboxylesterase